MYRYFTQLGESFQPVILLGAIHSVLPNKDSMFEEMVGISLRVDEETLPSAGLTGRTISLFGRGRSSPRLLQSSLTDLPPLALNPPFFTAPEKVEQVAVLLEESPRTESRLIGFASQWRWSSSPSNRGPRLRSPEASGQNLQGKDTCSASLLQTFLMPSCREFYGDQDIHSGFCSTAPVVEENAK